MGKNIYQGRNNGGKIYTWKKVKEKMEEKVEEKVKEKVEEILEEKDRGENKIN